MPIAFADPAAARWLDDATPEACDQLSFGLIAMDRTGVVTSYNAAESRLSGLSPGRVVGRHFFSAVAPCTNNFMVAGRFETEAALDETIDYVFTLRMAPTAVRLRMLKPPGGDRMYLLVERR
ncbi:PAS domain-containing protein [Stella sp.]|uniref:PAS domain-containing protein n=1 Tax=Stella sp. TaxID=2912054 RepID=UPI0035B39246